MKINNIDLKTFGAKVQNKVICHDPNLINTEWNSTSLLPSENETTKHLKPLEIKILFEGKTRDIVNNNISNFMALVTKCDIKFKDLSHTFRCYCTGSTPEETGISEWLFINISFVCFEYNQEATKTFDSLLSMNVVNNGNLRTPAIIEITTKIDMIKLDITGLAEEKITLKNLKANSPFILDGELQKATVEGVNKFSDVDLWEFPNLNVGNNTITLSSKDLKIKITYKTMYV